VAIGNYCHVASFQEELLSFMQHKKLSKSVDNFWRYTQKCEVCFLGENWKLTWFSTVTRYNLPDSPSKTQKISRWKHEITLFVVSPKVINEI
jgi:hypothetical protein